MKKTCLLNHGSGAGDNARNLREEPDAYWREKLTSRAYGIAREGDTEPAFTGKYWNTKTPAIYQCICCDQPLFDSDTKYDSGTGWPSFHSPIERDALLYKEDRSLGMTRTEICCKLCAAHLGHVFPDGPKPTGERYCMNSGALKLIPKKPA